MTAFTPNPAHHKKFFTRWYTQFCPRHEECSDTAWAKTKQCRSYESEDDCRLKIMEHFARSGKHNANPEKDLWESAQFSGIRTKRDPGHWFKEPPCETPGPDADMGLKSIGTPPSKRQRLSEEDGDSCDGSPNLLSQATPVGMADEAYLADDAEPADETPETSLQHYGNVIAKASAVAVTHAMKDFMKLICAGRGCCYSNAVAGGLAVVRNK